MEAATKILSSDALAGMSFVITGTLSRPRDDFKTLVEQHGGSVSSAISAKTTYLLAGEKGSSKLEKAANLGVKIIGEAAFLEMIRGIGERGTGNGVTE
jgi:DNA ligase (NAD+)